MGRSFLLGMAMAAQVAVAAPLAAQGGKPEAQPWRLMGLRTGFCIQFLLDPTAETLQALPQAFLPVSASEADDLHISLRGVVEARPEFASWSPSRLCFHAVDTVRTDTYTLADKSGRHPQLFGLWTVRAAPPGGPPRDVALELFSNSDRLIRSARLAGQVVRSARLDVGLVPVEDEEGVPSTEERFQVKIGKTLITWDGHLVGDSVGIPEPVRATWEVQGVRSGVASGILDLSPVHERPMAGSLKVDGKDALAKLLRASPTRFAGPAYRGGEGTILLDRQ
jgi:hypothetical protein